MMQEQDAAAYLYPMVMKFWLAPTLALAVQLKLPDLVAERAVTAEEAAAATSTHVGSMRRMLNALASEGIFTRGEDGRFGATAVTEMLRDRHPSALGHLLNSCAYGENFAAWGALEVAVRTGGSAFEARHGVAPWDYLRAHPDRREVFSTAMTAMTRVNEEAVIAAHDFGDFELAVDIGGNQGTMVGRLLQQNPKARGVVFDLPETVEAGRAAWREKDFASRLTAVGGDFFREVPVGDLYLLKNVLHDWSDEECVRILRSVRRAMLPGGRVAVIEAVLPEEPVAHLGWGLDMTMMAATGGMERTLSEYTRLLEAAGFKVLRWVATASLYGVMEAG